MPLPVIRRSFLSAIAAASIAGSTFAQDFSAMDVSTAEPVPTSCSASEITLIYKSCLKHCAQQIPEVIRCDDVNSRFMLVNCASEADQCGAEESSANVVRQAQVKRIADVCNDSIDFQLDEVKLMFAAAADVAAAMEKNQNLMSQSQQDTGSDRASVQTGMYPSKFGTYAQQKNAMYSAQPEPATRATREMYGGKQSQNQYELSEERNQGEMYEQIPVWEQAEGDESPVWDNGVTEEIEAYSSSITGKQQTFDNEIPKDESIDSENTQTYSGAGSSKPTFSGSSSSKPTQKDAGSSKPTYKGVGSSKPTYNGVGSSKPAMNGDDSSTPTYNGASSSKFTYDGTGSSKPTSSFTDVSKSSLTNIPNDGAISGQEKPKSAKEEDGGWWAPATSDETETYAWDGLSTSVKTSNNGEASKSVGTESVADTESIVGVGKTPTFNATKSKVMQYKSGNSTVFKSNKTSSGSGVGQIMPAAASILAVFFSTLFLSM